MFLDTKQYESIQDKDLQNASADWRLNILAYLTRTYPGQYNYFQILQKNTSS